MFAAEHSSATSGLVSVLRNILYAEAELEAIMRDCLKGGFRIPCNSPILPLKQPNGTEWRFEHNLITTNRIFIPRHPMVPNPHDL